MAKRTNDPLDLTEDEREALIRNDFATFIQATFSLVTPGVELIWGPYLDLLASRLQDLVTGDLRHLVVTMPPRHLKSQCVSVALPAFFLGHHPDKQVMCVSYGQDLAKKFAEDTRTIMMSALYEGVFDTRLTSKRQSLHAFTTIQGGVRRATSIEGTATGVGADLLIFDDPQKPGETLSDAIRKATNNAYEQTFLSRRNDPRTCRIVIVMQRLHEDDFVGHVTGLGGEWEILNLPALAEDDETISYRTFLGEHVFRRSKGEALHPARVPVSELDSIREQIGEAAWATQYMQRPTPAGGGVVKVNWFRRYTRAELPERFDKLCQSWDTASSIEERAAYSVCTTWGKKGRDIYLLDVVREKLEYPDLKRKVILLAGSWSANKVIIEQHASGIALIQELQKDSRVRVLGIKPQRDKQTRMMNQTATIEGGSVLVPFDAPWLADYLYELTVFPNGKHSDQVDSTSQALDWLVHGTAHEGILDYYRCLAEVNGLKPRDADEVFIMQSPPGAHQLLGIDGKEIRPGSDGLFYLTAAQARPVLSVIGWKRLNPPG